MRALRARQDYKVATLGIRKYISKSTTEILIHSFVSSKLDFGDSLLFGAQKRDIVKLQSVQNAAARIIAGLKNEIT